MDLAEFSADLGFRSSLASRVADVRRCVLSTLGELVCALAGVSGSINDARL